MSPTGEGAVSLSLEKVHVGVGGGALAGGSTLRSGREQGAGLGLLLGEGWLPGARRASLMLISGHCWQPRYCLLCVSTGKVGSETLQGAGAGGLGDEAPAAQQRGGIL